MRLCLIDTGPLVALLDRSEPEHRRVQRFLAQFNGRLITTGAVITEALYFLSDIGGGPAALVAFVEASATQIRDVFGVEALSAAARLMDKYADVPMDFPDATLVWTADETGADHILTLDRRGFRSFRFRKNRRFNLVLEE